MVNNKVGQNLEHQLCGSRPPRYLAYIISIISLNSTGADIGCYLYFLKSKPGEISKLSIHIFSDNILLYFYWIGQSCWSLPKFYLDITKCPKSCMQYLIVIRLLGTVYSRYLHTFTWTHHHNIYNIYLMHIYIYI